tara:strand:- start:466 stop:969 length:504 start_codon:yes stop_codon:yes gene_type:complete
MNFKIDDETRLNFNNMMKESGVEDNTNKIRKLKHSDKIREQVGIMMDIRKKYPRLGKKGINAMIDSKCNWLFNNYTNIYNRLKKNELDLRILDRFLSTLKEIEDSEVDQHDASVKVGHILKELYIDSVMKEEKKREKRESKHKKKFKKPVNKLTWAQYKRNFASEPH